MPTNKEKQILRLVENLFSVFQNNIKALEKKAAVLVKAALRASDEEKIRKALASIKEK